MKRFFAIKILSVNSGLLCYQDQFFHSLFSHILCLGNEALHRNASKFTSELRDDAVGTVLVAAFRDLQVAEMSTCCKDTFASCIRQIINITEFFEMISGYCFLQSLYDVAVGCSSKNSIDLRNLLDNLFLVSLCHTAGNDQCMAASCFFVFCHFKNGFHTLFLGILDKTAGIDHDCICLCFIVCDLMTSGCKKSQHFLRIRQVLVTAKRDE